MTENLERQIVDLVSMDRIYIPMSSFDGKLERRRPKIGKGIVSSEGFNGNYQGDRVYARLEEVNMEKARGMREGIEIFSERYPQYGRVLQGIIDETRIQREKHLYFGMQEEKRLSQQDYMNVMQELGLSSGRAEQFYPVVMEISRNLSRKRSEERSVLVG